MKNVENICTKDSPMPKGAKGTWVHPDAEMVDEDSGSMYGTYEKYKCPHCGMRFWVELPD